MATSFLEEFLESLLFWMDCWVVEQAWKEDSIKPYDLHMYDFTTEALNSLHSKISGDGTVPWLATISERMAEQQEVCSLMSTICAGQQSAEEESERQTEIQRRLREKHEVFLREWEEERRLIMRRRIA